MENSENAGQILLTKTLHLCWDFEIGGRDQLIEMVRRRKEDLLKTKVGNGL